MNRLIFAAFMAAVIAAAASAQDLGSSNKLFGRSKTSNPKTTKKPTERPRVVAKKTTAKKTASHSTVAAKKPVTAAKTGSKAASSKFSVEGERKATEARNSSGTKKGQTTKATPAATDASGRFSKFRDTAPTSDRGAAAHPKPTVVAPSTGRPVGLTDAAANDLFEDLIESGNKARDERNYVAAEAAYARAKTVKPRDARAVYGLGNLYSDQQRWEDAENAYRGALQISPNDAVARVALSYVLTQPITAPNLSERYEEAEKLARRAIEIAPSNALAWDQLGAALELRGLIGSETESAYRRAIELDPSFPPPYAHLGRLLRRRGMADESSVQYQNAIQRSTDVPTMILVADVMQSEQRYAESEDLLRRAVAQDPRNPMALLLLGRALVTKGDYAEAESVLQRSLAVSTNGFLPNSLLGTLYLRQGKLEMSENALLQAMHSVTPYEKRRLSQQFEALGDGYMKARRNRFAERVYKQALSLDSGDEALPGKLARAQHG